jgi:5-methylcytosine-specific restriction endonuclease McrA
MLYNNKIRKYRSRPEAATPRYKAWVKAVYKRDRYTCQMCGYHPKQYRHIQAHHIKKWSDYPSMRYLVSNGITLCYKCHKSVWGKEEQYEALFFSKIGAGKVSVDIMVELQKRLKEKENGKV